MCLRIGLLFLGLIVAAEPSSALSQSLSGKLSPILKRHRGVVGVSIKHLGNKESFQFQGDRPLATASMIKLAVMVEAYRQADAGNIDLSDQIVYEQSDKTPGSGILSKHFSFGTRLSLRDLIRLMIVYSDNSATNMVLDQVGIEATNRTMEQLGLKNTRVHSRVFDRSSSVDLAMSRKYGFGRSTANETVRLLEGLYRGKVAERSSCKQMLKHMIACKDSVKIRRFLPTGTKLAQKGGSVTGVRCSAGIIFTPGGAVAVCVMTNDNEDERWIVDNSASLLCAEVARTVYRHYSQGRRSRRSQQLLQVGSSGERVKSLQKALNWHLSSEPIGVDGEFGPITKAAVIRFQKLHKLKPSGVVDRATQAALKLPPPKKKKRTINVAKFNSQKLKRLKAENLNGPPVVSCKAYAIADLKTGKILSSRNASKRLDFASTTKIMTAYLVINYAKRHPEVFDEIVVFSKRADNTGGSTSRLRAAERITVGELLYGLMLPSGNDASVALGEHFGVKFTPGKVADKTDSLKLFVAAMNKTAAKLGMKSTHYENPHGLTHAKHKASASDLLKLSRAAMQLPLFRKIVGTRQHATKVTSVDGKSRVVIWRNTNRLLRREGYLGVKTGTTRAAGACLVSVSERNKRQLILVVLGSSNSTGRYIDSRNIFRWAWSQH